MHGYKQALHPGETFFKTSDALLHLRASLMFTSLAFNPLSVSVLLL